MNVRRIRAALAAFLLCLLAAQGWSQDYNFGPAKDSVAKLSQLNTEIANSRGQISGLFFGPAKIDVRCEYQCFIGICLRWATFYYNLDFSHWKPSMDSLLASQQQYSLNFNNNFQSQFRAWVGTVNNINAALQQTSANVTQLQADLPHLDPATASKRRQDIQNQLTEISRQIDSSSKQVQGLMSQVAAYLQQQNRNQESLAQQKASFATNVNASFQKMKEFIDQQPCSGNAWDQFNGFKGRINGSLDSIDKTLGSLRASASIADQSGSVLIGSMMNMANRMNLVTSQLAKAQTIQGTNDALSNLHIKVAAQAWQDFATYAAAQVGK